MTPALRNDKRLLSRCIAGEKKARDKFVRTFSDFIYRSIQYTFTNRHLDFNPSDVEDLHNTVFLNLFDNDCHKLKQYKGLNGCSLTTWIKIVTVRMVLNHIRKKGVDSMVWRKNRFALDDLPELKSNTAEAWALLEKAEQERLVQKKIQKLPARDRLFIKLHFAKGCSIKEVAEVMQLSVDNAYTVKHRAIQRLKEQVNKQ
jgi:RNA polymerase sigma factor (sigma-70 family)